MSESDRIFHPNSNSEGDAPFSGDVQWNEARRSRMPERKSFPSVWIILAPNFRFRQRKGHRGYGRTTVSSYRIRLGVDKFSFGSIRHPPPIKVTSPPTFFGPPASFIKGYVDLTNATDGFQSPNSRGYVTSARDKVKSLKET